MIFDLFVRASRGNRLWKLERCRVSFGKGNLHVKFPVRCSVSFFFWFFVLSVTEFEKILLSCCCCWCCCFRIDVVCYFFVLTFRILLAILHIEFKVFFVFVYYKIATSLISCCIVYFLMLLLLFLCVCLGEFFRKCLWYPYPCWAQPTACPLARTPRAPRSWVSGACLSSRDRSEMGI